MFITFWTHPVYIQYAMDEKWLYQDYGCSHDPSVIFLEPVIGFQVKWTKWLYSLKRMSPSCRYSGLSYSTGVSGATANSWFGWPQRRGSNISSSLSVMNKGRIKKDFIHSSFDLVFAWPVPAKKAADPIDLGLIGCLGGQGGIRGPVDSWSLHT